MRLLYTASDGRLRWIDNLLSDWAPPYAILSHTWDGQEVAFEDLKNLNSAEDIGEKSKTGWDKIRFCAQQAKRDGLNYFWVDTCCIDKANNMELQEAINSMFHWYQNAVKCYVYLSDVEYNTSIGDSESSQRWKSAFRKSRWFTRGWTLQELLAPRSVAFYSKEGELLGDKETLGETIHKITKIPINALRGQPLSKFSIEERLSWIAKRTTMFKEDKVYCLLGIFGVYLPLIYGEGEAHATLRLIEEIQKQQTRSGVSKRQTLSAATQLGSLRKDPQAVYESQMPQHPCAGIRLLECPPDGDLRLVSFDDDNPPPYAILSHTWIQGGEVTYNDLVAGRGKDNSKLQFCAQQARRDGLDYFWVDTCCINKSTVQELSTAINSMFLWYQHASVCYVYMPDVSVSDQVTDAVARKTTWVEAFQHSRWFTRGWTLQELLASNTVRFFSKEGVTLGTKRSLEQEVHETTQVPIEALRGRPLSEFSIEERLSWVTKRTTTFKEDKVYCLLGIFGVYLPPIYGEGEAHAALRLMREIQRRRTGCRLDETQISSASMQLNSLRKGSQVAHEGRLPQYASAGIRLLKSMPNGDFELVSFDDDSPPPYAILSHTWECEEITYDDLMAGAGRCKAAYRKLLFCAQQARRDGLDYFWIDTCCIDKSNSPELSRAINSMFRWYQRASVCYVYLSDIETRNLDGDGEPAWEWKRAFRKSRWFSRGWSLQELLAPATILFFSQEGEQLGSKLSLAEEIHDITQIPIEALRGRSLCDFTISERFSWAECRQTTREEDAVYCLLGIMGIFMPIIYGEGKAHALERLMAELDRSTAFDSQ